MHIYVQGIIAIISWLFAATAFLVLVFARARDHDKQNVFALIFVLLIIALFLQKWVV